MWINLVVLLRYCQFFITFVVMKDRLILLLICACAAMVTTAAPALPIEQLLNQFDKANGNERVNIANQLFEKHFAEIADTVYRYDNNVNQEYLESQVYVWAANEAVERAKYDQAAIYLNRALPLCRAHCNDEELGDCLSLLGIAYMRLGDLPTAIKYQEECLELDRKGGDKELISSSLNNVAGTCLSAGMVNHAVKYIEEAIKVERTLNRPAVLAIRLGMASEIYIKMGHNQKALEFAKEALAVEQQGGKPEKVPVRKSQLAAVYNAMGNNAEALKLLSQAETELRKTTNINSLAIVLNQIGNIELDHGNSAAAAAHLRESVSLCQQTGNQAIELKARQMLCTALRVSDPHAALVELEKYAALKDSIYNEQAAQSMSLFNVKYETAERENNINMLQQQVRSNRLMLGILGVVLLAAIVVSLLLARLARQREMRNKTLIKANLLKDQLLEIAQQQLDNLPVEQQEQLVQVAHEMGSMGDMPQVKITRREREVMLLCCEGMLAKEIADRLNISQRTVETHKNNLFKKLGINNTVELVRYAQAIGAVRA